MKNILKLVLMAAITVFIAAAPEEIFGQTTPCPVVKKNQFLLTAFSPAYTGALYIYRGTTPTNLVSITPSNTPAFQAWDVRDSSMIQIGNLFYMVYNDEQSNSCQVLVSSDLTNWTECWIIFVPPQFRTFWSPKFVVANGTIYLTAFVQSTHDYNYYMGVGIMSSDLRTLYNFQTMTLSDNTASGATDPNSAGVYYHDGIFYLFDGGSDEDQYGSGNEYASTDIMGNDWSLIQQGLFFGLGEFLSKKFALNPGWTLFLIFILVDVISAAAWLPAIFEKNQLSITGVIWSIVSLMATVSIGVLAFQEKLTLTQSVGLVLGLGAVILLSK